jgi:molybdopterin/thiamine biosynthesis adenylyltransferase
VALPNCVETPSSLTNQQVIRYCRQIILPELGGKGQKKLLASRVAIVGAGGLGSPAALYLAAAGVGALGIVDGDLVDLSNLHRQLLHRTSDVGRLKTDSARETIQAVNPDVRVTTFPVRLAASNAGAILADFDIVLGCSDNFPTRYLLNDACYLLKKPLVDGSIFRFEGQATNYLPGQGCYRCLFPAPPPPGAVPSCAETGVLGVLPGLVGVIQATEAIKTILGIGRSLAGRLLLIDALSMDFREVELRRNPACPLCGDFPTITRLLDHEQSCATGIASPATATKGDSP